MTAKNHATSARRLATRLALSDEQWQRMLKRLPGMLGTRATGNADAYRAFIEEVLWVAANDAFWRELEPGNRHWHSVYVRFLRWVDGGVWDRVIPMIEDQPALAAALTRRIDEYRRVRSRRDGRASSR